MIAHTVTESSFKNSPYLKRRLLILSIYLEILYTEIFYKTSINVKEYGYSEVVRKREKVFIAFLISVYYFHI